MVFAGVRGVESVELGGWAKVEEKTHFQVRGAEVIQQLSRCGFMQLEGRLELDHHLLIDYEIQPLLAKLGSILINSHPKLTRNIQAKLKQFLFQRRRVHVLEKTKPEPIIHPKKCTNHDPRQLFFRQRMRSAGSHPASSAVPVQSQHQNLRRRIARTRPPRARSPTASPPAQQHAAPHPAAAAPAGSRATP
jgi:hypothetical protein